MLSETLGRWHFWLLVIGFNLTFGPQHIAGVLGMPRRIYTYAPGRGWELWNLLSSIGVALQALAVLFFVWNVLRALRQGPPAGDDPWDAWTLEWTTTSHRQSITSRRYQRSIAVPAPLGLEAPVRSGLAPRISRRAWQ